MPDFLRDLEAKLLATLKHFLHPFESRLMASIDSLTQTTVALKASVDALTVRIATQPQNVATQEQLDALQAALEPLIAAIDALDVAPTG